MAKGIRSQHKTLHYVTKILTILIVGAIIVLIFPKINSFNYTYRKGMPWRYETLIAPYDFAIHKTSEEIKAEAEKLISEQPPIFQYNDAVLNNILPKFTDKINEFRDLISDDILNIIVDEFENIYKRGILLLPESIDQEQVKSVLIVKDNIANKEDFERVYTLKKAYSALIDKIYDSDLPELTINTLTESNLNNYIKTNLEYDAVKTKAATESALKNINPTQGKIRKGETIISQNDIVTPELYKNLESYRIEHNIQSGSAEDKIGIIIAQSILTFIALISFTIFLYFSKKRLFYNNKDFIFLYCMFLLTIILASLSNTFNINILIIPVLFFPIIVNILFGTRTALYLLLATTMLTTYFATNNHMYIFMQLTGGIVALFSLRQLHRRGQLFLAIALVLLTYTLVYGSFTLIQQGTFVTKDLIALAFLLINALLLTATYPVLYLVEKLFGYTSDISLIELSNPNHPVLRRLTKKAPGTFQHSLMVANLAEEAIYHIGGSPLLARTGALYHDIGKIFNPIMFIENQTGGVNPHDSYDYDESAKIIIEHVTKGVELAHKYKLPESIINFIRTHHGKSKVKYFYNSFKNKYPDREIDEAIFTYPGPDPSIKEHAVVMMADAVEAASRSLEVKNEENIGNLVNNIIDGQLHDGRFKNAEATFRDIEIVKRVYTEMLINVYHARIAYPNLKNGKIDKK